MEKKSTNRAFVNNAFDLVRFAWDKKWILILLSFVAFVASVIISLSITPRFKAGVVLFPAASVSLSKSLVETSSISTDNRDILSFGEDEEAERMLQILHSNRIKEHVINKFNLLNHYEIDLNKPYPYTKLENRYKSNIRFRRTEFMSIEITVLDKDAQMAADIANEIASYVDSAIHNIQKERAIEAFYIVEKEYRNAEKEVAMISDSLQKIRQLGVIDYESQASALNTAYANAITRGDQAAANIVLSRMNTLSKYGGGYVELTKKLESEITRLGQLKSKYVSAKVNVEQSIPQIFVVDQAKKPERKAVPKRSLIVIVSTISAFAISLLILLIIEQVKTES
jgi:uncharacterized protein involved in exopolysaccharide biosynthesis